MALIHRTTDPILPIIRCSSFRLRLARSVPCEPLGSLRSDRRESYGLNFSAVTAWAQFTMGKAGSMPPVCRFVAWDAPGMVAYFVSRSAAIWR